MEDQSRAIYDEMIRKDYCSQWMGVELLHIRQGYCQLKMTVRQEMLNGFGLLHGGIAYAFADSAFAFASNSYGRISVSINGTMNYSKSAREGDVLIAEATEVSVTNKTATFDVALKEEQSGELFYSFRGMVYRTTKEVLPNPE